MSSDEEEGGVVEAPLPKYRVRFSDIPEEKQVKAVRRKPAITNQ